MRPHKACIRQLEIARSQERCAVAPTEEIGAAFRRRIQAGEIISPYRGVFVEASYWNSLTLTQKVQHQARAISILHPGIVFAGTTAAALLQYEHPRDIHRSGMYIASTHSPNIRPIGRRLGRIHVASPVSIKVGETLVTSPEQTLVDCARMLPLCKALPIYDSAIAQDGTLPQRIAEISKTLQTGTESIEKALRHANPKSDNGGESFVRGVMIECGFQDPIIQYVIRNPHNPNEWYRVDFIWFTPSGRVVIAEFDGMAKYTDPSMTGGKTVQCIVNEQRDRERNLRQWGATTIVRIYFEDALHRERLIEKLRAAEVPEHPFKMTPTL